MFKVKGTALAIEQIDLFVRRAELMFVEQYRKLIWLTLKELVQDSAGDWVEKESKLLLQAQEVKK